MEFSSGRSQVVVSCDWFALSCMLAHPYRGEAFALPSGWSSLVCGSTSVWQHRWFIMDDLGNKLATILATPRSPIIDARRAVVEIANPVLYSAEFRSITDAVLSALPLSVEGINRVDLCGDFNMTENLWQVVRGLEGGDYYLKGLRRGVVWWSADNGRRVPHQISWGGRDSVFHWKLYNKYKELHEAGLDSAKPYIESMWQACGLDVKHVWRLEVSVTSTNSVERWDGGGRIQPFEWFDERVPIWSGIYCSKFVIRENQGHANKRYDPVVEFLMSQGETERFLKHKAPSERDRESSVERRVVCKMWKEFQDGEVRANTFLWSAIGEFLRTMCQFERNVNAICRRFNLSRTDVFKELDIVHEAQFANTLNINEILETARKDWA